ncbi:MAG: hypothetical protein GF331_08755 [Chitinivibrionales bacterium]|nr:hypothetical protein [Chitinivibrionales bacterium]
MRFRGTLCTRRRNMERRSFGTRSGLKVAPVSIGAMRLPGDGLDGVALVRKAIDAGMRYIDTSRGYGESEFVLGKALKDGYREKVALSTKCSPWIKKVTDSDDGSADSVLRRIEESLLRLDVPYLDFYQVWNIHNRDAWELATKKGGMVDGIKKAMANGLVKHTGFTTHDSVDNLLEYLPQADWAEVILVSYNLLNRTYAPVLAKAHELGIGTIVMNPVGGGKFAENSPVLATLAEQVGAASVADLAVRFVASNPDVDTMLCGMSKPADVDDTIASVERGTFSDTQMDTIRAYFDERSREKVSFCTGCNYCMPCPQGIQIPQIMGAIYEDRFLGLKEGAKGAYGWATREVKPDACTKCKACEKKCTQKLEITRELEYALREYGG